MLKRRLSAAWRCLWSENRYVHLMPLRAIAFDTVAVGSGFPSKFTFKAFSDGKVELVLEFDVDGYYSGLASAQKIANDVAEPVIGKTDMIGAARSLRRGIAANGF
jgi:hypothetical protein